MALNNVLYIHGFNSGKGKKVTTLQNEGYTVFCPQLKNNVKEDLLTLENLIKEESILSIIGTSLGGYYGLILSQFFKQKDYYLINPSYKPYITLKKHLGETLENFKTSEKFKVNKEFIEGLKEVQPEIKNVPLAVINFYIGTNDEVLDYKEFTNDLLSLQKPLNIFKEQQDHRFQDISLVVKHLKENTTSNNLNQ
ncbi:YqiA/YcfP family alpha/beta fold hydrolase [Tenacibaculum aestuarii]|uniref:YqiA/YcfP family alpha/beta fold hydrolase n=1 Tax=Tenacibaculum aestuarii TaxID=362781 RepID=UPI003893DDD5